MPDYLELCLKLFLALFVFGFSTPVFSAQPFPTSPDPQLTPGSLCAKPNAKRYPEGIAYCERRVASELKAEVMEKYDQLLGYRVTAMRRQLFKIDHYIPLCMGGSNEAENLWPQHESVYSQTDPLEELVCTKMALGRLRQQEAVSIIRQAKADPRRASEFLKVLQAR